MRLGIGTPPSLTGVFMAELEILVKYGIIAVTTGEERFSPLRRDACVRPSGRTMYRAPRRDCSTAPLHRCGNRDAPREAQQVRVRSADRARCALWIHGAHRSRRRS